MRRAVFIVILALFLIAGCLQQPIASKKQGTSVEAPKEIQGEQEENKESCTIGWKCVDKNRKGYQFSDCVFTQVNICTNGCKDGECLPSPEEKKEQKTFSLNEGRGIVNSLEWKQCDFSEGQIFLDGVADQDFKIKLYAKTTGYNYFNAESQSAGLWLINKPIADALRSDCMDRIADADSYSYLRTRQTLCIKTKEGNIALVGGYWDGVPDESTKLIWKYYS